MAASYIPILLMVLVAAGFAALALGIAWLMGPSRPDPSKDETYECGVPPVGDARERFSVRFYVVAMLFIVFDLETVFLFPWAVIFRQSTLFFFLEMLVFLGLLLVGYIYVWRTGALEWSTPKGQALFGPQHVIRETKHEAGRP